MCAEIHVLTVRNAAQIFIELNVANGIRSKAHQASAEAADGHWVRRAKARRIPVDRLAIVMKWSAHEEIAPREGGAGRKTIICDDPRYAGCRRKPVIRSQQLFYEIRFQTHIIIEEEPDIAIRNLHGAVPSLCAARDRRIVNVVQPDPIASALWSRGQEAENLAPAIVPGALVDDDQLIRQYSLREQRFNRQLQVFWAILGRYDDGNRKHWACSRCGRTISNGLHLPSAWTRPAEEVVEFAC